MIKNTNKKRIGMDILKLVIYNILVFLVCFEIFYIISKYINIHNSILIIGPIVISLIIVFGWIFIKSKLNDNIKTKLNEYKKMHFLDLIYLYIFLLFFLVALNHYKNLSLVKFEKMLSYSWILIGLSITIFIFGYVLVDSFLGGVKKNKVNKKLDINNYYDVSKYIEESDNYSNKIKEMNFPITMLLINAIINSIATIFIIFLDDKFTSIKKIIIILSLVISINTFICLITNITKPFIKERLKLNKEKKNEDIVLNKLYLEILEKKEKDNICNFINDKIEITNGIIDLINNNKGKDIIKIINDLNIDEIIKTLNNYSKYLKEDFNKNEAINILKNNIKVIMEYMIKE